MPEPPFLNTHILNFVYNHKKLIIMTYISDILYWISTGMLVPVVVLLILLFIRSLILAGAFFGQYYNIRKNNIFLTGKINSLKAGNIAEFEKSLPEKTAMPVIQYMKRILDSKDNAANIKRLLANFEIEADKDISTSKTLIKMGPILGLMGTLIPMGPALAGLASGDISSMAYNMQIAFATTVVGLFAGAVGFLTQQAKQRWFTQDITNLEFVAETINKDSLR